jgi:hypothetical protein
MEAAAELVIGIDVARASLEIACGQPANDGDSATTPTASPHWSGGSGH